MSRFKGRRVVLLSAVAALALAAASAAFATSATGNQNPDLLVSASLVSSGANPDVAVYHDTIDESVSVTNVSDQRQPVRIIVDNPFTGPDVSHVRQMNPGETWTWSQRVKVNHKLASGDYALDAFAVGSGSIDPSQAEATITVDNG